MISLSLNYLISIIICFSISVVFRNFSAARQLFSAFIFLSIMNSIISVKKFVNTKKIKLTCYMEWFLQIRFNFSDIWMDLYKLNNRIFFDMFLPSLHQRLADESCQGLQLFPKVLHLLLVILVFKLSVKVVLVLVVIVNVLDGRNIKRVSWSIQRD